MAKELSVEERMNLVREVAMEIVEESELRELFRKKKHFVAYDGFEPSGKIHIAQGLRRTININKMIKAGAKFKMLVADWHSWANNKMGGDLEKIQTVGKYFIEVWKACGMDLDNVEFVWANDIIEDRDYWKIVMGIALNSTIKRIIRCGTILGRKEAEMNQASQVMSVLLQAADIFYLKADVCQLGIDQRKVNVLARELGPKLGFWKPIIASHGMMMGLQKPVSDEKNLLERTIELKMSKSRPDTAIYMTDSTEEVFRKLKKAYCPEKEVRDNPVLEYCNLIVFEKVKEFVIERSEKFGGNVSFSSYDGLEKAYRKGEIHPVDLKQATAKYIDSFLEPIRKHFRENKVARELLKKVEGFEVTR